ncbi:nuclear transport factor 2 family protein [Streptomyces albidoflavus]|uniref:nuclear transport factor 2 family protein n=1 Tax=Streptomyces albidoflavus TaxID=1886 RepID=UPI0033DD2CE1
MSTDAETTLHPLFAEMVRCTAERDLDGLLKLYHPEAEWVRFTGTVRGHDEIRELLSRYWELDLQHVEMNEFIQTDDTVMMRGTMKVRGETVVTFGVYVLRDGLIWRQCGADEGGTRDWWA